MPNNDEQIGRHIGEKSSSVPSKMSVDWDQFTNEIEATIADKRRRMTWARAIYYAWTVALIAAVVYLFLIVYEQKEQIVGQRKQLEVIIKNERIERERQVKKSELEIREAKRIAFEQVGRLSSEVFLRDLGVKRSFADYEEKLEATRAQLRTELDKKANRTELTAELEKKVDKAELTAELEKKVDKPANYPNFAPPGIYPKGGNIPLPGPSRSN